MAAPYFSQVLASQRANGTLFNTYTTAVTVLNPSDLLPIPANYIQVGSKFRIRAWGGLSNIVTTPGTVTFQNVLNGVAVWSSGALQMPNVANTLSPFLCESVIRCSAVGNGTTATFIGGGTVIGLTVLLAAGADPTVTDTTLLVPAGAPGNGTGFNSAATANLDFFVGFSISNAGNGVQLYDYTVEQLQ